MLIGWLCGRYVVEEVKELERYRAGGIEERIWLFGWGKKRIFKTNRYLKPCCSKTRVSSILQTITSKLHMGEQDRTERGSSLLIYERERKNFFFFSRK